MSELTDKDRKRARSLLIADFQKLHRVFAGANRGKRTDMIVQQKLIEMLLVRAALLCVEPDETPAETLERMLGEVRHMVDRFWAPDVALGDDFLMEMMVAPKRGRR